MASVFFITKRGLHGNFDGVLKGGASIKAEYQTVIALRNTFTRKEVEKGFFLVKIKDLVLNKGEKNA